MLKYLIFLFLLTKCTNSARILGIFWTPSKSHHLAGVPLLQALARKGHEVHVMSSFKDNVDIPTYKQELLTGILGPSDTPSKSTSNVPLMGNFFKAYNDLNEKTEKFWKNEAVQTLIEYKPKYDVVICLAFFTDHIFALAHHLNAPLILFSSISASIIGNKFVGNPNLPYFSHQYLENSPDTFIGRLGFVSLNMLMSTAEKLILMPAQESIKRKYLPNSPSISELHRNISLIFVNSHFSIEEPRPYVPNMIPIGGYYTAEAGKLPELYQKFLNSATNGVILFSMGTNLKIGTNFMDKMGILMKTFKKLAPIQILFKSEIPIPATPSNVMVVEWVPSQTNVLAHPNLKLFITHGGLGGTTEAVYHGVPILGIPFFADQKSNIGFVVKAGFGLKLNVDEITDETFEKSLKELLNNPIYAKNAKKRSILFRNQPIKPMNHAIWWVEHIIQHKGGEHLKNMAVDLAWYELYMVDIMLFYFMLILINIVLFIVGVRYLNKLIGKKTEIVKKKNLKKVKKN